VLLNIFEKRGERKYRGKWIWIKKTRKEQGTHEIKDLSSVADP
jgi:hypothetical protein